jgi:DNA recombination protein RmuC
MVILIAALVLLLIAATATIVVLATRRPDPLALEQVQAAALADLEARLDARRAEDRAASAALLQSVVAEQGVTVEQAVHSVVALAADKLSEKAAAGTDQLDLRQQTIDRQVATVTGELEQVRALVESLKQQGAAQHGALNRALLEAADQQQRLHATTDQLRQALASPKTRGQWGERMAEDVLRAAGMVEGINYRKQTTLAGGTRPDITFFMPRGQLLNMDVKFPIDNYLRHLDADHPGEADAARAAFVKDVRLRVKEITTRDYIDPERTPGYVLLFIPNESLVAFMHQHDPGLADHALAQRVILCSPYTLFAVLGVVRHAMDQFLLERTSDEILQCLGGLTGEWSKFTAQLDKVGNAVDRLQNAYTTLGTTRRRAFERKLDQIEAVREQQGLTEGARHADDDCPGAAARPTFELPPIDRRPAEDGAVPFLLRDALGDRPQSAIAAS